VDELMDMARTTVNLVGNCLATAVMARWEGEFTPGVPAGPGEMVDAALGDPDGPLGASEASRTVPAHAVAAVDGAHPRGV
jgi:proton glutamate symport protein